MATLTAQELASLRQGIESEGVPAGVIKPTLNAAFQAIETWFENNRAGLGTAIDAATSPFVFTAAQKKALGKWWLRQKFDRGG